MNDNQSLDGLLADSRNAVRIASIAAELLVKRGGATPSEIADMLDFLHNIDVALEQLITRVRP